MSSADPLAAIKWQSLRLSLPDREGVFTPFQAALLHPHHWRLFGVEHELLFPTHPDNMKVNRVPPRLPTSTPQLFGNESDDSLGSDEDYEAEIEEDPITFFKLGEEHNDWKDALPNLQESIMNFSDISLPTWAQSMGTFPGLIARPCPVVENKEKHSCK